MTTKKRAKPEHLQKLTSLFEQYPDGLNMRQIQTELQTSAVNAQAALDELGAVKAHNGATADRVRELTGMHPDDIADAVQCMVDHGQLIGREVYFATVYEVAA